MKKLSVVLALIVALSLLAGCAQPTATPEASSKDQPTTAPVEAKATEAPAATEPPAKPEPTLTAQEAWLKAAGLGDFAPEKQDWAAIEEAAKKEGSLTVFSNSSRVADAAATFAEKYPDIKIEALDMGGSDVITKVREEQTAGAFTGDVWLSAGGPDIEGEFIPNRYLWKFLPDELASLIPEASQNPVVTSNTEVFGWVYNTELNKSCPISNWWQLTDPEWKGKVYIKDPLNSAEDLGMLISAATHADEFAKAYQDLYGKAPVLEEDTPDAGWLWIKKFAQNAPIGTPGGDETWEAMATPGMKDSAIGWLPLSKYRNVLKGDAVFAPCKGLAPVAGIQKHNYVAVINQAPHPNAAKVFIRFILSEEGFKPWNQVGQYASRTDIQPVKDALPFADLPVWDFENLFVYKNITQYRDFYALNLLSQ